MGRERHAGIERQQQQQTAATRDRAKPPVQRVEAPGPAMGALPSPGALLALQRTIGNAAVNHLLRQQAPTVPVQRMIAPSPSVQREAADEDEEVQMMPSAQRLHAASASTDGKDIAARIRAARGGGSALDGGVQRALEAGLGASLSGVRVHTSDEADSLSRSVQAVAFTTGSDIFFRSGAYNPATPGGLHLLAHEATHTMQQAAGPVAGTPHPGGVSISDPGDSFERAAEASAARVTAEATAQTAQRAAAGSAPLQRLVGTSTTHATPIQRVWDFNNPAWGTTQSISTLSSGQAVFFLHDNTNDTIVVKGEDTPIGLTILNAGIHQEIHGARSVRTRDVTGAKATIMNLLNDPAKTSDGSWTALGNSSLGQRDWITADLANQGIVGAAATPEIRARYLQQQQLPTLPKVHAMELVQGNTAKNLSDPNKIVGIMQGGAQAMRSLVMDQAHLRQLGMVTAADLYLENPDRVMSANFGNWFVAAAGAVTLIDNLDANAKGMWRKGTGLGTAKMLGKLAKGALQQTADEAADLLVSGMSASGDTTAAAWALQPYGNGTRKQFMAEQFRAGLSQGRERIIALYAKKPGLFASKDVKKIRKLTKQGVKGMQAADTATGDWQAGHSKYWERLKARARWLKAN